MKVGFIGIGMMGEAFATLIMQAGNEMVVCDFNKKAVDKMVKAGATAAESPKEVAEMCRIVCTSLPGPPEIEAVVLGSNGILAGAKKGDVYIDFSTNSPALVRKIAAEAKKKGVDVLDAPVSGGGPNVAWAKGETVLVGGDKEVLEKSRSVIEPMCKAISHCGGNGAGMVVKLINNYACFVIFDLFFEAMSIAAREELDLNVMWERFSNNILGPLFKNFLTSRALVGNFDPLFTIDLMYKDVKLAMDEGKEMGVPTYYGSLSLERIIEARAKGMGQKDVTSMALLWEELLDIKIRL
jgi:3-hydroxyisobutyrate dehydrogenase-like beta-hydroxyacid dehydrogenase